MNDKEFETKEKKIQTQDRIEPQHIKKNMQHRSLMHNKIAEVELEGFKKTLQQLTIHF